MRPGSSSVTCQLDVRPICQPLVPPCLCIVSGEPVQSADLRAALRTMVSTRTTQEHRGTGAEVNPVVGRISRQPIDGASRLSMSR